MKPTQKVLGGRKDVKVAIVQTPPVFLDREKTIDRACRKITEAAGQGAELIVFPEAWVSGYPYWSEGWGSTLQKWAAVRILFYDNAIIIPSEDTDRLCGAAAKANAHVVIGCNEMDPCVGVHTMYNTLLFIDRSGKILGRHRKVMPTFVERAVWGSGDGSDLVSYDTDIGRIGGLICGEHLMTLVRARMIDQGEDFHVAVFPGAFCLHSGPKLEEADREGRYFWGHTLTRSHALEAGAFVLSSCGYITPDDIPPDFPLFETLNIDYAHGGSSIISPIGIPLAPPTSGDTIIYAVCEADMIKVWKAIIDTAGHYSRPDIVSLNYHPIKNIVKAVEQTPRDELERTAEQHGVSADTVEATVERLGPKD
ncbi:MAG: carbon-nitrogen hydrolase family protein [Deltaproteobacteria bacterium]|nr:carbon-nitrogen hydrolase family protein [Deltaproteobacteria bacterium]